MSDFFDWTLHYLGQNMKDVFVLNIGSMDGVLFDEMYAYTLMYNFRGLYVEPIPYLFEKLKKNMLSSGNLFENSAIMDYDGETEMLMINSDAIDDGTVNSCFYGMSAVYPPRNGLASEGDKATVEKFGSKIKVPCITFDTLLHRHNILSFDVVKMDAEGYDYQIFKQIDINKYKPKIIRLEWINLSKDEYDCMIETLDKNNYVYEIGDQDITAIPKELHDLLLSPSISTKINDNTTFVTGLWNIGRGELDGNWSRTYQDYLDRFSQLLDADINMIIFGDIDLESFVWKKRHQHNTLFILRDNDWFRNNGYYNHIQDIRKDSKWYSQATWLENSPQAKLELYNPIVMSKIFLLNDAKIFDPFNSDYMFWIDAGLSNTVHPGYFTHDKVHLKLPKYIKKFTFVTFDYEANSEIHGFTYDKICTYAGTSVNKVARGGFFGGPKTSIVSINAIYYNLLMDTLRNNLMGTEESLFSIMLYKYPNIIDYIEIMPDGLMWKFFEDLKNDTIVTNKYIG